MVNSVELLLSGLGIELARFQTINFFPTQPSDLNELKSICIATKSRNLGDALALSGLPVALKKKYPQLRITTYPRSFNPVVFFGNPAVEGLTYLPGSVFGDDCNAGKGQLIQLKEQYFGLEVSQQPRPELYLLPSEVRAAQRRVLRQHLPGNEGKPLCILHPWGMTHSSVLNVELWDSFVRTWSVQYRFWQVGIEGQLAVQGCEYYLLLPRAFRNARKLFAAMNCGDLFVGVDSGPMHVARAFNLPSLILINHADPDTVFKARNDEPYFIHDNWKHSALYSENTHLGVTRLNRETLRKRIDEFFEQHLHQHRTQKRGNPTSP